MVRGVAGCVDDAKGPIPSSTVSPSASRRVGCGGSIRHPSSATRSRGHGRIVSSGPIKNQPSRSASCRRSQLSYIPSATSR